MHATSARDIGTCRNGGTHCHRFTSSLARESEETGVCEERNINVVVVQEAAEGGSHYCLDLSRARSARCVHRACLRRGERDGGHAMVGGVGDGRRARESCTAGAGAASEEDREGWSWTDATANAPAWPLRQRSARWAPHSSITLAVRGGSARGKSRGHRAAGKWEQALRRRSRMSCGGCAPLRRAPRAGRRHVSRPTPCQTAQSEARCLIPPRLHGGGREGGGRTRRGQRGSINVCDSLTTTTHVARRRLDRARRRGRACGARR